MSKRITRVPSAQLESKKAFLSEGIIDIVLKSGQVHKGTVTQWTNEKILFKDRLWRKHVFLISEISEIIKDQVV